MSKISVEIIWGHERLKELAHIRSRQLYCLVEDRGGTVAIVFLRTYVELSSKSVDSDSEGTFEGYIVAHASVHVPEEDAKRIFSKNKPEKYSSYKEDKEETNRVLCCDIVSLFFFI